MSEHLPVIEIVLFSCLMVFVFSTCTSNKKPMITATRLDEYTAQVTCMRGGHNVPINIYLKRSEQKGFRNMVQVSHTGGHCRTKTEETVSCLCISGTSVVCNVSENVPIAVGYLWRCSTFRGNKRVNSDTINISGFALSANSLTLSTIERTSSARRYTSADPSPEATKWSDIENDGNTIASDREYNSTKSFLSTNGDEKQYRNLEDASTNSPIIITVGSIGWLLMFAVIVSFCVYRRRIVGSSVSDQNVQTYYLQPIFNTLRRLRTQHEDANALTNVKVVMPPPISMPSDIFEVPQEENNTNSQQYESIPLYHFSTVVETDDQIPIHDSASNSAHVRITNLEVECECYDQISTDESSSSNGHGHSIRSLLNCVSLPTELSDVSFVIDCTDTSDTKTYVNSGHERIEKTDNDHEMSQNSALAVKNKSYTM